MSYLYRTIFLISLLNLCFACKGTQTEHISEIDAPPLDSSIRYGRLSNGFTYFLKSIPGPQDKTYLRLYNKAGGNQEDLDQLELSHAVEHLAFKATKNFPLGLRNDKKMSRQDMGMYDATAVNGNKSTTYIFDAPHNNGEALELGFLWFRDIISGLKLTEKDIDQVRGELRQETISRNGKDLNAFIMKGELRSLLFPCKAASSNLFDHLENFSSQSLKRFYKDWYHPDKMGLSMVGNIGDLDEMERRIKKSFSCLPSPEARREPKHCDTEYFQQEPQFLTVERLPDTSKVLQNNEVNMKLFFRDPVTHKNLRNMEGPKRLILMQLLNSLINDRIREATNDYQSFYFGSRHLYESKGLPPALEIIMESREGKEKEVINKAIHYLNQIKKYGFQEMEWEKGKQRRLEYLHSISEEDANYWIKEIEKNYVRGEALPSNKLHDLREWLDGYTLTEFNDFVRQFLKNNPEDIAIIAPSGSKALSYSEKEVRSWIENEFRHPSEPFTPPKIPSSLLTQEELAKLHEAEYVDNGTGASGAREVVLENGLKIVLKPYAPTSESKTRIKIHGFSLKGADCFPKEDYFSAINAPSIVKHAGVHGLDKFQMNRFLSRKSISPGGIFPYVLDQESGIQGNADLVDFEIMLQLIYLHFTRPNKDRMAFEDWKIQEKEAFRDPSYDLSRSDLNNAIMEILGEKPKSSVMGKKILSGTRRYEGVQRTNYTKAYQAYEKLFKNAKDFTFLISGDFEETSILPLVQKYLGNLPNSPYDFCDTLVGGDNGKLPDGPEFVEIPAPEYYRLKNVSYGIRFIEEADDSDGWKEKLRIEALAAITNQKAWTLRHQKGFSLYMIGVGGKFNEDMNRYEIGSTLDCVPEEFPMIRKEFKQIVSEIKSGEISEEEFKQGLQRMYSIYSSKRGNLPRVMDPKLYNHYRYGQSWLEPVEIESFVRSLTVEDIVGTANKIYKDNNFFEFVMRDKEF